MIWVQTGMLLHARTLKDGYFHVLSHAETRALFSKARRPRLANRHVA